MLKFLVQNKLGAILTPKKFGKEGGFTLVEMLVSLTVLAIIASILLFDSQRFEGQVALTNMAHEVALELRLAQTSAVGSARPAPELLEGEGSLFSDSKQGLCPDGRPGFPQGVSFDTSGAVERSRLISFIDIDCNYQYNDAPEELRTVQLVQGITLKNIHTQTNPQVQEFSPATNLTVVFERPNFGARFYSDGEELTSVGLVKIELENERGSTRAAVVTSVGQIYVE